MGKLIREINIDNTVIAVDLVRPVVRWPDNPILTARDVNKVWTDPGRQVMTVHNAGVCRFGRKVVMLFRSHLRNGISVIGMAQSNNGLDDWEISPGPVMMPCGPEDSYAAGVSVADLIENEAGGVEDPRITRIGDQYYITYSAYHGLDADRVRVSLAVTADFKTFTRHGPVMDTDMRNMVIFPEVINGRYVALMRPNAQVDGDHVGDIFKEIRLAYSNDIEKNEWIMAEEPVMRQEGGPSPFKDKIGPGAPPIKTRHGWLNIFHGVRSTMDGNPYVLGVALHSLDDHSQVQVSSIPILFPAPADCAIAPEEYRHVPQVVFTCGALRNSDGSIYIYYGGNDTVMNLAVAHEDILAALCNSYPQDPATGQPLYKL